MIQRPAPGGAQRACNRWRQAEGRSPRWIEVDHVEAQRRDADRVPIGLLLLHRIRRRPRRHYRFLRLPPPRPDLRTSARPRFLSSGKNRGWHNRLAEWRGCRPGDTVREVRTSGCCGPRAARGRRAVTFASQNMTCHKERDRLYYYCHGVRGPNQEKSGSWPGEAAHRCAKAAVPANSGPRGRRPDPEELAELLPARTGPIPLPPELPLRCVLDMSPQRDRDRGVLCWLS